MDGSMLRHGFKAAFLSAALAVALAAPVPTQAQAQAPAPAQQLRWTAAPAAESQPAARHENAAVVLDGALYLIGGRGQRPLDILDLKTGEWRRGAAPPMEINHTQAVAHEGRIYVIGALNGPFPQENVVPHVLIYEPGVDRWSTGPELPPDRRRGAGGLVVHDGVFYLVGGNRLGHRSGSVPWLDRFDPRAGTWTKLPDAPRPRDHFHAAVLDGKIYAPGGRTSSQDTGQTIALSVPLMDIYDIASGRWTTARDPIPTQRSGVAVAAIGSLVVVVGGESDSQQSAHAEVEAYDPAAGAWRSLPDLPVGRHGTQAVVVDRTLQVVAGSRNRGGGPELNDRWILGGF